MSSLLAFSISIAVLGGVWTYIALGPLNGFVLVWAGFIGWGSFFHCGGDEKGLLKAVAGTAYGAIVAWFCLRILTAPPMPAWNAVYPAIVVGMTVFLLVIVAGFEPLSAVPANVYGYAALLAYSLHQSAVPPEAGPLQNLLTPAFANPLVLIIFSATLGAVFGWLSDQVARALLKAVPASA